MNVWQGKCQSCGWQGEVTALTEQQAIELLKVLHNSERNHIKCDFGPQIENACNLSSPDYPSTAKEW